MLLQKIDSKEIFVLPNLISFFRILAAITILIAAIIREIHLWVAILYLAAVASDKIDGVVARFFKKRTRLGQILEPIADSILSYAVVTYLYLNLTFPKLIFYTAIILLIFGAAMNVYFYLKRRKWYIPSLDSSRVALVVLYTAGVFYFFNLPYKIIFVYIALVCGLFGYFDYLWKLWRTNEKF